ncbi:MAG TPA: hypothetical protein PLW75_02135 [Hyphomicrobium sp.]|nr:hypothetical protein [Hyphomicrobium sp.]
MERIVINHDDFGRFILAHTSAQPPELALMALIKPLINEPALYTPIVGLPDARPWWLTEDPIKTGRVFAFETDLDRWPSTSAIKWRHLDRWLKLSNAHRSNAGHRKGRKWIKRLERIETLDEALSLADRDIRRWKRRPPQGARARDLEDRRVADELEKRGEIVRIATVADGRVWFELLSERAILQEGDMMRNRLLGLSRYQYMDGVARLFSLRGAGVEHQVTFGMPLFLTLHARRRCDQPIDATDHEAIAVLMRALHFDIFLKIRRRPALENSGVMRDVWSCLTSDLAN